MSNSITKIFTHLGNRCKHQWTLIHKCDVSSEFGWEKTVLLLTCTSCGKIKKVTIK